MQFSLVVGVPAHHPENPPMESLNFMIFLTSKTPKYKNVVSLGNLQSIKFKMKVSLLVRL